jgi:peptide-methionine (S)-S-oxide reductase
MQIATFAGGCFWRMQTVFSRVPGVLSTTVGYAGGHVPNPTYAQVSTGQTGHAESVQIVFDPRIVSYDQLLHMFFSNHDASQVDRQGADIGPQYRSIIFVNNMAQWQHATRFIHYLRTSQMLPVVTQVVANQPFYPAEAYHQFYEARQQGSQRFY